MLSSVVTTLTMLLPLLVMALKTEMNISSSETLGDQPGEKKDTSEWLLIKMETVSVVFFWTLLDQLLIEN